MRPTGDKVMTSLRNVLLATLIAIVGAAMSLAAGANAADAILSGTITSAAGEKLGGVTVSAKPVDGTVTTTVFTDASGEYYFPPLPAGKDPPPAPATEVPTLKTPLPP